MTSSCNSDYSSSFANSFGLLKHDLRTKFKSYTSKTSKIFSCIATRLIYRILRFSSLFSLLNMKSKISLQMLSTNLLGCINYLLRLLAKWTVKTIYRSMKRWYFHILYIFISLITYGISLTILFVFLWYVFNYTEKHISVFLFLGLKSEVQISCSEENEFPKFFSWKYI